MALYEVHTFNIPLTFKGLLGLQFKSEAKSDTVHVSHLDNDFEADKRGVRRFDIFTLVTKSPELKNKNATFYEIVLSGLQQRPCKFIVRRPYQRIQTPPELGNGKYALHRFVLSTSKDIGVDLKTRRSVTSVFSVLPSSLAARHGIVVGDILCKFGSSGRILGTLADLRGNEEDADSTLHIEVLRLVTRYYPISNLKEQELLNYDAKPTTPLINNNQPKSPLNTTSTPKSPSNTPSTPKSPLNTNNSPSSKPKSPLNVHQNPH